MGCSVPSVHCTWLETIAGRFGARPIPSCSAASAPGAGIVSSSISHSHSWPSSWASPRPWWNPPAPPRFSASASSRAWGKRSRTISAVPSVLALSTTMISSTASVCSASACRHSASRSRRLKVTTIAQVIGTRPPRLTTAQE